jgi:hypothetical protein
MWVEPGVLLGNIFNPLMPGMRQAVLGLLRGEFIDRD